MGIEVVDEKHDRGRTRALAIGEAAEKVRHANGARSSDLELGAISSSAIPSSAFSRTLARCRFAPDTRQASTICSRAARSSFVRCMIQRFSIDLRARIPVPMETNTDPSRR
jgi:hypothetical protein